MDFKREKAWMVRQDGEAFPCLCLVYGSSEDIEETLYAAQWLYEHTAFDRTKELCLSLFKAYGISLSEHRNCVRSILTQISHLIISFKKRASQRGKRRGADRMEPSSTDGGRVVSVPGVSPESAENRR